MPTLAGVAQLGRTSRPDSWNEDWRHAIYSRDGWGVFLLASTAKSVRVSGRVQGVCFRAWTKEQANRLAVCGWVRNCADGSVRAHLEGDAKAVERLIGAMRLGPSGAKVERVDVEAAFAGHVDRFEVRY